MYNFEEEKVIRYNLRVRKYKFPSIIESIYKEHLCLFLSYSVNWLNSVSVAVRDASFIDSLDHQHDVENRPPWIVFPVCFGGCKKSKDIYFELWYIHTCKCKYCKYLNPFVGCILHRKVPAGWKASHMQPWDLLFWRPTWCTRLLCLLLHVREIEQEFRQELWFWLHCGWHAHGDAQC